MASPTKWKFWVRSQQTMKSSWKQPSWKVEGFGEAGANIVGGNMKGSDSSSGTAMISIGSSKIDHRKPARLERRKIY